MKLAGTLLFHLNLNYSAIEVAERGEVVRRCYRPLLGLCERLPWLTLALEASAFTLEEIERLDPAWIARLRSLVRAGRVEFVGCGDTQLIGPLVPAAVNRWNQRLGQETYARLLGVRPSTALVGEMAWSQGLVDAYAEAGYRTLLMEWHNPRRQHPEWRGEWRYRLAATESPGGRRMELAWIDAVAFQKFQRAVTGDLSVEEYVDYVASHAGDRPRHLFLYGSDAEVFDYRPGRFASEPPLAAEESEWRRIEELLVALRARGVAFTTPRDLAADASLAPEAVLTLPTAADPIPVKKQPKYNVTRWALTGRDDVGLNARCFARAAELSASAAATAEDWRALCRAWASDHRTHLTETRWRELPRLGAPVGRRSSEPEPAVRPLAVAETRREGDRLFVRTDGLTAELNLRRGLALTSLAFEGVADGPLLGTLPHGHFDDIDWAADFYSGNTVLELPAAPRVTDLERVEPAVDRRADRIEVSADVPTALGPLPKRLTFFADRIELAYGLSRLGERPVGSLRAGMLTLFEEGFGPDLGVTCAHGGAPERFALTGECDHGRSVSALISAGAAFGATDGEIALDDGRVRLVASWPQGEAAALPLVTHKYIAGRRFVRLSFSLSELDETHRAGASLHDFRLSLRAERIAA